MVRRRHYFPALTAFFMGTLAPAYGQDVIIVTAPGGSADMDDARLLTTQDIEAVSGPDVLRALSTQVAGVSLSEAQGNAYQPSLVYRGFSASALQGSAQGLAVYLDGGRFNLPFGDTVNFDLLPDSAIDSVSLRDSNPIYGLNALGGAVVVATHNGKSAPGLSAGIGRGDHGRTKADVAYGSAKDGRSLFVAGQVQRDGGWRDYSPSRLYHGFADLGWDGARAGVHIKLLAADTDLTGNGAAPVELLAADRAAVFTHPDRTQNRLLRGSFHPWVAVGAASRIEASLYAQTLRQRTANGDLADIAPCATDSRILCLESLDDETSPLVGLTGAILPVQAGVEDYGVFNRSRTSSDGGGLVLQFVTQAELFQIGHALTLGVSHDRASSRFSAETELGALEEDRAVTGLGPILRQPDGAIAPVGVDVQSRATGLFLWDEVALSSRLTAEIGLRWNQVAIDMDDQIGTLLDGTHRFRRLNPGLEFDYRLAKGASLRFGYAETSRAPTPAELSCADENAPCSLTNFFVADPPLDQVVAKSWEAGSDGVWQAAGWQGRWSIALYRTAISNDLLLTAAQTRGRAFFQNIGQTRREGIEAHGTARRGPWSLDIGYAFTRAQFRSPFVANSPGNPNADEEGRIQILPSNHLPGIPMHRGLASLGYDAGPWTFKADMHAQSGQWRMGDESNVDRKLAGFVRFDLGAAVKLGRGLTAYLDVTNIFNRHHATFGAYSETDEIDLDEVPGASDPRANSPAAPRRILFGLRWRR